MDESKTLTKKRSRIGLFLSKRYDIYINEKKCLMNHPKIIEYLFNKPTEKINCLKDLLIEYDSTIKTVRLERKDAIVITANFFVIIETLKRYSLVNQLYNKYLSKITGNSKIMINYLPRISDLSRGELQIMKILDKLEMKYKMSYVYKWNFLQEGENLVRFKRPTINYEQPFVYDFYGILINHGQLVQFVIEYDDDTHFDITFPNFPKIHITDIMKQYILFQMNINLLRLNKKSNMKNEMIFFLKKIRNTTKYITHNPIKPVAKYLNNLSENNDLKQFVSDYEYNHIIYLKIPVKKNPLYDSDDNNFFDNQIDKNIYSNEPADTGLIVTEDILQSIIDEKKDLHPYPDKNQEADNIIVELLKTSRLN